MKAKLVGMDFAKAIFESCKNSVRVTPISSTQYTTAATRPKYSVLDTARAKKVFNSIPYKWEISLKKAIENR